MEEQEEGLLAEGEGQVFCEKEEEYKEDWELRTIWVIFLSTVAVLVVFAALFSFTRYVITPNSQSRPPPGTMIAQNFRRPESEYILDRFWDHSAQPKTREYNWTIVDIVGNPDGVFRPMITINGQFPGPLIECNEGDTLVINVENKARNATSIHFHGVFQNGTNWMDGTSGVSQCPITPGRNFQYRFSINGQAGTYYYHGHQAVQASDGLFGPLVVHAKDELRLQKIPYASDRVVMLQDYYHDLSSGLLFSSMKPGSEASPKPDGALMNGLNRRDCSTLPHRMCDSSSASLSSFELSEHANHRLRFINVGAFAWFHVSIDEHKLAITEADGTDLLPSYETKLMISPAQRYSVIINSNTTTCPSVWLRARMMTHCWGDPIESPREASEVRAIIRFSSNKQSHRAVSSPTTQVLPTSQDWKQNFHQDCKDMNTSNFIPASFQPPPKVATYSYYLESNMEIGDWRLERGFFNHSSLRMDLSKPCLHRILKSLHSTDDSSAFHHDGVNELHTGSSKGLIIQHREPQTIDLIIRSFDEGNHPMHLHGHKFWILGTGHGPFPGYASLGLKDEGKGTLDGHSNALDNLMRRDVATVEGFGWLALRVVVDNPGVWAFHCHMAWHSEKGLGMLLVSGLDAMRGWELPRENVELCEAGVEELEKGAPPKDDIWVGDFTPSEEELSDEYDGW